MDNERGRGLPLVKMASESEQGTSSGNRRAYTLEFKLCVLDWMKRHSESTRGTARRFGIHRRMIQRWKESEAELNQALAANGARRKKIHQLNQPQHQELEEKMLKWFVSQKGVLCDSKIRDVALDIAKDIGLDNFKASPCWIASFRDRHTPLKDPHRSSLLNKSSLKPTKTLCTAVPYSNSFLTRLNPNEFVKLKFTDGDPAGQYQDNTVVYYDYQAPDHNYCRSETATTVHTTMLSDRCLSNDHDQQVISHYCNHHSINVFFELLIIMPVNNFDW